MNKVRYDANDLAKMILRNVDEFNKECNGKKVCGDPTECVAKVIRAPLETLAFSEAEVAKRGNALNHANRLIELFAQNLGGAVQVTDPAIVEAAENYLGRKLSGPASHN